MAQIIYTSGSTGLPKGVTLSHANLWAGMQAVCSYLEISRDDRIASLLPFSFDYGLNQLLCAVASGATLVIERSPVPQRIVKTLREQEVTLLATVPPSWLQLLTVSSFACEPMASLRCMTNTGGLLPAEAVRQLRRSQPHAQLFLMYGLTEAFRSAYLDPAKVDDKPSSFGSAIPGAELLVLRENGTECEPGEIGELVHRGPTVALGYWDDPALTERVFRPNPLVSRGTPSAERVVFSGDHVRRDADGDLFFVGRRDNMIKTLGYRVSPDEIVDVLYASGEVVEAVVAPEPDDAKGNRIVAFVVLRNDGRLDRLQSFCAAELPRYMQPERFEVARRARANAQREVRRRGHRIDSRWILIPKGTHELSGTARAVRRHPPQRRTTGAATLRPRVREPILGCARRRPRGDSARRWTRTAHLTCSTRHSAGTHCLDARRLTRCAESHGLDFNYADIVLTPGAMAALHLALRDVCATRR